MYGLPGTPRKNGMLRPEDVVLETLEATSLQEFLCAGIQAYTDHYCHLWPAGNPAPYIDRNLQVPVVRTEMAHPAYRHWLVRTPEGAAGICVVSKGADYPGFHPGNSLFIEKIYLKKEFTGQGVGTRVLDILLENCRRSGITGIWLKAMAKGPAREFYLKAGFRKIGISTIPYPEVLPAEAPMWVMGRDV